MIFQKIKILIQTPRGKILGKIWKYAILYMLFSGPKNWKTCQFTPFPPFTRIFWCDNPWPLGSQELQSQDQTQPNSHFQKDHCKRGEGGFSLIIFPRGVWGFTKMIFQKKIVWAFRAVYLCCLKLDLTIWQAYTS